MATSSVAASDGFTELELRLYRLELQLMGVELSGSKRDPAKALETPAGRAPTKGPAKSSPSPIKAMAPLSGESQNEGDEAALDTQSSLPSSLQDSDLSSRLTALEQVVASKSSMHRDALESHWKEINHFLQELDPGTALTYQQQIAAPLVYRRQEVLACANELQRNMEYVAEILNLLLIGQTIQPNNKRGNAPQDPITEMHVTKAPILMTAPSLSREEQEQLNQLQNKLQNMQGRVDTVACHMDQLLTNYQTLVTAVSEKMVLLDEELRPPTVPKQTRD